jgi:hypothetical protein
MQTIKKELTEEQRRQNRMALGERMLASKRQMQKEMREDWEKPEIQAAIAKLRKRNEERGTPIVRI